MKRLLIIILILAIAPTVKAQYVHSPNDKITSLNWDIIEMVRFKKINDTTLTPIYNETVKRFENRHFKLTGYMVPLKLGKKQSAFMISTLPVSQCAFCGKNGNPIMILVMMKEPIAFAYLPVTVEGLLNLDEGNAYFSPPVSLTETIPVQEK